MSKAPRKWADSRAEVIRTVAVITSCVGTIYLVGAKLGQW